MSDRFKTRLRRIFMPGPFVIVVEAVCFVMALVAYARERELLMGALALGYGALLIVFVALLPTRGTNRT